MAPKATRLPNISKAANRNGNISSTPTTGISAPICPANAAVQSGGTNGVGTYPSRQRRCASTAAQSGGTNGERFVEIPQRYYVASQVDLTHIDAGSYNLLRMPFQISASRNLPVFLVDKPPALLPSLRTLVHQYVQPATGYAPLSSRQ